MGTGTGQSEEMLPRQQASLTPGSSLNLGPPTAYQQDRAWDTGRAGDGMLDVVVRARGEFRPRSRPRDPS